MRTEINVALDFLSYYFYSKLPRRRVNVFLDDMEEKLIDRYQAHWYPDKPNKGSAFRCLKLNSHKTDPILLEATTKAGFDPLEISSCIPEDLTIWIDPGEVSFRMGNRGKPVVIYNASSLLGQQDDSGTTTSTTPNNNNNKQRSSSPDSNHSSKSSQQPVHLNRRYLLHPFHNIAHHHQRTLLTSPSLSTTSNNNSSSSNLISPISSLLSYGSVVRSPFPGRESTSSTRSSPVFTTETFARTRFGSTKFKNEYNTPKNIVNYASRDRSQPQNVLHHHHHHHHNHNQPTNEYSPLAWSYQPSSPPNNQWHQTYHHQQHLPLTINPELVLQNHQHPQSHRVPAAPAQFNQTAHPQFTQQIPPIENGLRDYAFRHNHQFPPINQQQQYPQSEQFRIVQFPTQFPQLTFYPQPTSNGLILNDNSIIPPLLDQWTMTNNRAGPMIAAAQPTSATMFTISANQNTHQILDSQFDHFNNRMIFHG